MIHGIGKKLKMEAVYKHCVKDPQIERHFHADMRALARTTAAARFPRGSRRRSLPQLMQEPLVMALIMWTPMSAMRTERLAVAQTV
jgi:hypothetical protein